MNDLVESGFIGGQVGRPLTTQEAVAQGKAVLDGGATKTLGSVRAIEKVMQLNQEFNGTTCLKALDLYKTDPRLALEIPAKTHVSPRPRSESRQMARKVAFEFTLWTRGMVRFCLA